jgi:hypothetical protein
VSIRMLTNHSLAALVGVTILSAQLDSAEAFTLSGLVLKRHAAPSQISKVWSKGDWRTGEGLIWNHGWAWPGARWRPHAVPGSAGAAGAALDATVALRPPYGACWRQAPGSNGGWRWGRNC